MLTQKLHDKFVYDRRMNLLSDIISSQLHDGEKVLDIGCGDGKIDYLIMQKKNVKIHGVDVLLRDKRYIPVEEYDGKLLPFNDDSFDVVIFIDVLHHIENQIDILTEAKRVAREIIIIKDHLLKGVLANATLKFMDYFGNAHYGVALTYNYLDKTTWESIFIKLDLDPKIWVDKLNLYPFPFNLLFDRKLHFVTNLLVRKKGVVHPLAN